MTAHSHSHDQPHGHAHGPAGEHPPAGGPVVLDIGGNVGALIVHLDDERLIGHELHVRPVGAVGDTTHTGIWQRRIGDRDEVLAIFPELVADTYDVFDMGGAVAAKLTVHGGAIAELTMHLQHV
jgi:hypothetical protein